MTKTIENVKIVKSFLGREQHGILTCYLTVEGNGFGTALGGYALESFDKIKQKRTASQIGFELVDRILEVVGVASWEELQGKYVRIETNGTKIGNLIKDEWLDFESFFDDIKQ